MSNYRKCADDLMHFLDLSVPPVAIAFSDSMPTGVTVFDGVVPAGCVFWQLAATRTFATSTRDHELCSIGTHTHHMALPSKSYQSELKRTLEAMSGLDYVREEEVAAIPMLEHEVKHVIYGPLADFPLEPEVVLLFAHAQQGLILSEAAARVDKGAPPAMGRPACAVVPQVVNHGHAAMSLGCCGARAYLDSLSDSVAMWGFPGSKIGQYCEQIAILSRANKTLTAFHTRRREDVESGRRPTVEQSLSRVSS